MFAWKHTTLVERSRRPLIGALASLFLLFVLVYGVSIPSGTLLGRDDSLLQIPILSHWGNIPAIVSPDFLVHTDGQYRPFPYLIVAVLRTIVPNDFYSVWHFFLFIFHAANTLLIFLIARHFSQHLDVSWIAAAVFAFHPLGTLLVHDINQIHLLIGLTLSLGFLSMYFSFSERGCVKPYLGAAVLFILALLSAKPPVFLGFFLLVYERLYRGRSWKNTFWNTIPFFLIPLFFLPVWISIQSNPIFYKYLAVTPSSILFSFYSAVAASGRYFAALLMSWGIPSILHESTPQVYSPANAGFIVWLGVDLAVLAAALILVIRKYWGALGACLAAVAMLPYTSIAFNPVIHYVSYSYLYFPLAGFTLMAGGVYERCFRINRNGLGRMARLAAGLFIVFYLGRTLHINLLIGEPVSYWKHVRIWNESSPTAHYEMGLLYLRSGRLEEALPCFFYPGVDGLQRPCLAMAEYYQRRGDRLAAAVHLRLSQIKQVQTGLLERDYAAAAGELFYHIGALDYAEHHYGRLLMIDPYYSPAMIRLAQIWHRKGRVTAARRILERARDIDPGDLRISIAEREFWDREKSWETNPEGLIFQPPDPDWLRYILHEEFTPRLLDEIAALSDRSDPNDAVIQLEAAIARLESGQLEQAASTIKTALNRLSGNAYTCAIACRILALAGDPGQAIQIGSRAISIDVQNTLAWDGLALAYAMQDQPNEISLQFLQAIQKLPSVAAVFYFHLGVQKKRKGLYQEAIELLERSLAASPGNPDAYSVLGDAYWQLGQTENAIKTFQKAVTLNPGSAEVHGNLGGALLQGGRIEEAMKEIRTAIQLDSQNALYRSNLGVALAQLGRDEEALVEYQKALELDSTQGSIHFNYANSLSRLGRDEEAIVAYRRTLELMPDHPHAHFNLAQILAGKEQPEKAIEEYKKQIERNPDFHPAYPALIQLYINRDQWESAREIVERAQNRNIFIETKILHLLEQFAPKP